MSGLTNNLRRMKQKRPLFIAIAVIAIVGSIWYYVFLSTPPQQTLDQQAHDVGEQLKCPVCQSESVADSTSTLAQQMRGVIRQQLQAGKSEQEVIAYFQARYGNQIVWSPQWQGFSMLAWLVPIFLLLGGFILLFFVLRDWYKVSPANDSGNVGDSVTDEAESFEGDEQELERFRARLERELAEEDPIFMQASRSRRSRREVL
nr:cytochrome c-type biogenesis protein CcmH [Ktedonobacteraceae bacterium]